MSYSNLVTRKELAHSSNYKSANRVTADIKYIVIHYTANDGDSDEGNANYFKSANRKASAHFFVDDDSITQSVNIKDIAWHCGGSVYNDIKTTGGASLHGVCTNTNSIGIEMCDTYKNGQYDLSTKTRENTIKLVRALMSDFNIDINHVVRHFDVTGKYCPRYFCPPYGSNDEWDKFKSEIMNTSTPTPQTQHVAPAPQPTRKSNEEVAREVLNGLWGNGDDRKNKLKAAGYDYNTIQSIVNSLLGTKSNNKASNPAPSRKSNEEIAREVIKGLWGNGADRKARLANAGYNYSAIQKEVNRLL